MWVLNSCRCWEKVKASMAGTEMQTDILILLSLGPGWYWLAVCGLSASGGNALNAEYPLCLLRASLGQVARNDPLIEDTQNKISFPIFCPTSSVCRSKHPHPTNQVLSVVFVGKNRQS